MTSFPDHVRRIIRDYFLPFPNHWIPSKPNDRVLIIGIGGGYDIFTCLPWFLWFYPDEKDRCVLANYSFTDDLWRYDPNDRFVVPVTGTSPNRTKKNQDYFPEQDLAKALDRTIYAIRMIPQPLLQKAMNQWLCTFERPITRVILVDGGVDGMLYGDEARWGSPIEDLQWLLARFGEGSLPVHIISSALYVDGVTPETWLNHWKEFRGRKWETRIDNVEEFQSVLRVSPYRSIIQESIIAAVQGHRGRYVNPFLKDRIEDPNDMPDLREETCFLFHLESVEEWCRGSPLYQYLSSFSSKETNIERLWIQWNQMLGKFRPEVAKKKRATSSTATRWENRHGA